MKKILNLHPIWKLTIIWILFSNMTELLYFWDIWRHQNEIRNVPIYEAGDLKLSKYKSLHMSFNHIRKEYEFQNYNEMAHYSSENFNEWHFDEDIRGKNMHLSLYSFRLFWFFNFKYKFRMNYKFNKGHVIYSYRLERVFEDNWNEIIVQ